MPVSLFWLLITLFLTFPTTLGTLDHFPIQLKHESIENADRIHNEAIIVDSHIDTMMNVLHENTWLPDIDIGENTSLHADIPKLEEGGINVGFFAAFTEGYYDNNPRSISRTLALIHALYWMEENNQDHFQIAKTTFDIWNTVQAGKIAAVPTIEGAYSLEEHNAIELLHQYHDLGIKAIGFNWNYSNALGEGANQIYGDPARTPSNGGLTQLGAQVAKEMNKLGMVIDVSHMSENTFWDVLEITDAPIMATHSGVKALKNHQRNLTDEQLIALAENGGVVGIVFYPVFLTDNPSAYVTDIADHIDYAVDLIGIDHVAIGSDFDGSDMPSDLQSATELYKLTDELQNRGYSDEDIEKILGKNTLRLLLEVEKAATINPYAKGLNIEINPEYKMGEIIEETTPTIKATIDAPADAIKTLDFRVIVDGIAYEADVDESSSTLSFKLTDSLVEQFHVVTFEATDKDGKVERTTRIFYLDEEA
ncbi:dipeptidase [Oceanobacillus polygoni]|uniref:Membrane dipeptidase n=1 Tax=Oceanobacillus polygoni TaxID=1235259 RepID=A0A9X1CBN2_9BACI|nr:dipeptidase [Oceanobacillus polygoni]MBP2077141.1 membrane dipeptidase [Oceanobacillus polygoni]